MIIKTGVSLAFAVACLTSVAVTSAARAQVSESTTVVTNGPQTSPGDMSGGWSARRNVIQSRHYDRLLETNRGFRHARMRKECGPIGDPQLRADCFASFGQDEPFVGSSTPRHHYRSDYGR